MKKLSLTSKGLLATGALLVAAVALAAPFEIKEIQQYFKSGFYVGSGSTASTSNKVTKVLGGSATVDFASTTVGCIESSAITVTGAVAGDACAVGTTTAAGALKASFSCYVSATNEVKVKFCPQGFTIGTCTLDGASPAVCPAQTVIASSVCTCSNVGTTAAIAEMDCAVSVTSTTLTITADNSANSNVNYWCAAPIDPASGTFYVRVTSAQ